MVRRQEVAGQLNLIGPPFGAALPRSAYLEYEHLFDEQLCLVMPTGHPLGRDKRIAPHDLLKHPFILPPKGGADRKAFDRFMRRHNVADPLPIAGMRPGGLRGMGIAIYVAEGWAGPR
jgi:DNA-binding transcriptional LysR family regulator